MSEQRAGLDRLRDACQELVAQLGQDRRQPPRHGRYRDSICDTDRLLRLIKAAGGEAVFIKADVSKAAEVEVLVKKAVETYGQLDCAFNNAGIEGEVAQTSDCTEENWDRTIAINLKGVWLVSRAVIPSMIRRGSGDIVNIGSLAGKNPLAGGSIYAASKWGLRGLTTSMAEELREHGIRVSLISPGSVATEFQPATGHDASKKLRPEDVAHAAEMILLQGAQSFLSEVDLRPLRKR